jgi:hypothetical protein
VCVAGVDVRAHLAWCGLSVPMWLSTSCDWRQVKQAQHPLAAAPCGVTAVRIATCGPSMAMMRSALRADQRALPATRSPFMWRIANVGHRDGAVSPRSTSFCTVSWNTAIDAGAVEAPAVVPTSA